MSDPAAAAATGPAGRLADRARAILDGTLAPPPIAQLIGFRPMALRCGTCRRMDRESDEAASARVVVSSRAVAPV